MGVSKSIQDTVSITPDLECAASKIQPAVDKNTECKRGRVETANRLEDTQLLKEKESMSLPAQENRAK